MNDRIGPDRASPISDGEPTPDRDEAAPDASGEACRALLESLDDGFCTIELLFDEDGRPHDYRFLHVNAAFERQTGLKHAAGKTARELVPNHPSHWFERFGLIIRAGRPERFEAPQEALGRWYEVYAMPVGDPGRHQLAVLFRDILPRLRQEARLRESEAGFRAFVTAIADIVYRMSPDWREMRELDGQGLLTDTPEPNEGWRKRYIHPDDLPTVDAAIARAIATRTTFELEHRVRHADGSLGWVLSRAVPLLDAKGGISEWLGAARDVTARRQAEDALRESEERFRNLADHAPVMIWVTDASGRCTYLNRSWYDFTGQTREEAEGFGWLSATHPDDKVESERIFHEATARREPFRIEYRLRRADGVYCWAIDAASPRFDSQGRFLGHVGHVIDIDERRKIEERLREAERRQAFLLELSDALRPLSDPLAVQEVAARRLGQYLGVSRALYTELRIEDGQEYVVVERDYHTGDTASVAGRHRSEQFESDLVLHRAGHPVIVADTERELATEAEKAVWRGLGARSYLGAPYVKEGRLRATFGVQHATPRAWSENEVALVRDAAERTWTAVERARTEQALRASEERLRLVVEGARDHAIFTVDAEGRVVDWYAGAESVFGYAADEIRGVSFSVLFTPEDREAGAPARELIVARNEGIAPDQRWHLRQDGGRVYIEGRTVRLQDADRGLGVFLKIGLDATRRHEAEERLRESEGRFRQFAEASSDVIWIRNAETLLYEYVSPAFETVYGGDLKELLASNDLKRWAEYIHTDDRARTLDNLRSVRGGQRITHEFRIRRPDGDERWIRDTDFPLLDANGRVQRVAGIGQDVTELKRAEAVIAESEGRLRSLMEGIPQLVWRARDEGMWTWASPQWCDFTGQTQEESHGRGWLAAVHPDDREATIRAWEEARPHGLLDAEYRVFRAWDRTWVWHHARSAPVRDADGRIVEWLGTSTDVQVLKELQERQGVLVGELQHRTRNLIGVVRSMADKSIRASADLNDFRGRFGDRMQALSRVQGLLSRLSEGERVTFDALLAAELAAMDAADDPRVELDGPGGVALRSGSVQTLALAIHELATNAVKYGALSRAGRRTGARLRIAWRVLPPDGEPRPRLLIEWRETGVAMPSAGSKPQGAGQGRELIERALPYQLDAKTTYLLRADGVECSIIIPVSSYPEIESESHV